MAETSKILPRAGTKTVLIPIVVVLVIVLYWPVLGSLVEQWLEDPNYRHGLLVPVISGLLLYRRRGELAAARPGGGVLPGTLLIVLSGILIVGGTAAGELMTSRLSLPTFLLGVAFLTKGREFTRIAAFPLLFLYAMIPLPYMIYYKLTFPLQLFSAKASAAFLDYLGVSVVRQGNILHVPNYTLEVVTACSGLRSLMTMITLALVIGAVGELRTPARMILVAVAVPAAIAANTLRLVVTSLGAYLVSPSFADGFLHDLSGMVVFVTGFVVLLLVYLAARRLE